MGFRDQMARFGGPAQVAEGQLRSCNIHKKASAIGTPSGPGVAMSGDDGCAFGPFRGSADPLQTKRGCTAGNGGTAAAALGQFAAAAAGLAAPMRAVGMRQSSSARLESPSRASGVLVVGFADGVSNINLPGSLSLGQDAYLGTSPIPSPMSGVKWSWEMKSGESVLCDFEEV